MLHMQADPQVRIERVILLGECMALAWLCGADEACGRSLSAVLRHNSTIRQVSRDQ